jgi:sulfonate transport system permease protein
MLEGGEQFKMDVVIVCIIVIGLIGLAMNQGIRALESHFLHWKTGFAR